MRRKSIRRYLKTAGYGAAAGVLAITLACASGDSPGGRGRDARVAEQVEDHLSRARAEMKAGNYDRAMSAVDKAYELDRDNREAIRLRQEILAQGGTQDTGGSATALAQADRLLKSGRYEEAAKGYREILAADPRNADAQEGLKRAQKQLSESREDEIKDIAKQADRAIDRGELEEAETLLAQAKELDATSSRVRDLERDLQRAADEREREAAKAADEARKRAEEAAAAARMEEQKRVEREAADAKRAAEEKKAAEAKAAEQEAARAEAAREAEVEARRAEAAAAAEKAAQEAAAKKATEEKMAADAMKVAEAKKAAEAEAARKAEAEAQAKKAEEMAAKEKAEAMAAAKKAEDEAAAKKASEMAAAKKAESKQATEVQEKPVEKEVVVAQATETAKSTADRADEAKMAEEKKAADAKKAAEEMKAEEKKRNEAAEERRDQAEEVFKAGRDIYEEKPLTLEKLEAARAKWEQAVELDPNFDQATVYLADTQAEYDRLTAKRDEAAGFEARDRAAEQKLDTLIRINTIQPTALPEFLRTIKLLSGIDFVLTGGVETRIEADFTDKPLREVLNSILLPIGLKWERKPGEDVVVITPDLRTQVFPVTPDQLNTVESLIGRGTLPELLWGQAEPAMQGQEIYTDSRQSVVVMTDSVRNLEKMRNLLGELRNQDPVGLVYQSFTIQEDKAQQIKALIDAMIRVNDDTPYNPERKLIIEAGELIIKDTPENIRRVEELLKDRDFLQRIYSGELAIATFNLTPILEIQDNPDLSRQFGETVRQQVETLLYAQEGRAKANSEGRRLWYDEATLQLTITDFPERITAVQQFIESLPQIERKRRTKIVPIYWATAAELASQIDTFLGGGSSDDESGAEGDEVVKTMRTEGEFEFRGAFFRVTAVNENDIDDENDDEVEIIARSGDESDEITIEEFRLENVLGGEFTIVAEDIRPGSTAGEGRAKLRFIYQGADGGGGGGGFDEGQGGGGGGNQQDEDEEDTVDEEPLLDIRVEPIENLNSLFISYTNATDLQEVEFWIETLDVPTLQVSMEVKFVEVIENKARELKSSLATGDLTQGLSLSDSVVRSRFAQNIDEFRNPFEPGVEGFSSGANLLKGTTVFDWVINNGETPISLQIQALEAQGIINVVNAPSVTVLNNETANFTITRQYYTTFVSGASNNTGGGGNTGGNTGGTTGGATGGATTGGGGTGGGSGGVFNQTLLQTGTSIDLVDNLEVTPTVTQAGNITLNPIDVVIRDFDTNLASLDFLFDPTAASVGGTVAPYSVVNNAGYGVLEKDIETSARIRDGGTVVLGGWKNERSQLLDSGVPILRDIPFVGKFLFNRMTQTNDRVTLLIFMTGSVVRD